jgi:hypothetical protein
MTETIDQLIHARFDAVASTFDGSDWNDVLARVRRAEPNPRLRRVPRHVVLAAAVAVLAVTVTAVAFGWPQTFVDFFSSPSAPENVKNLFGGQNVAAPSGMSPEAIPGEAREITSATFDADHIGASHPTLHTLYVAPRKGGGFCYLWTDFSGGCVDATTAKGPLSMSWVGNDYTVVVGGSVRAGAARTVEARFADGATATIPITWVSPPIDAGFFVYPVPPAHQTRADALASVVALDADGNVIGRQDFRLTDPLDEDVMQTLPDGTSFSLPRRADAANARKIVSFRSTKGNEIYLWTMPRTGGGVCYLFNRGGGCPSAPSGAGLPTLNGGLSSGADPILFFAQTTPDVATVELRYQNGESERLSPVEGFVLTEITPTHYAQGSRLVSAVALDQSGNALDTERFQPQDVGVYPCQTPTDLGYGLTACP